MVFGFPELTYKEQESKQLDLGPTASSLDLLQAVYRDPTQQLTTRMRAAMACLPFESPKLLATAIIDERDFATLLDQRLKRIEQMKLIEAKPNNEKGGSVGARPAPINSGSPFPQNLTPTRQKRISLS
jgi:hypothetical protein